MTEIIGFATGTVQCDYEEGILADEGNTCIPLIMI